MSRASFDELHQDVGAYLLGALSEDERAVFEAHLGECEDCRGEVAELRPAAHALPASVEQRSAPEGLRGRILADAAHDAEVPADLGAHAADASARPRRRRARWAPTLHPAFSLGLAVVALLVGLAVGDLVRDPGSREPTGGRPSAPVSRSITATVDARQAPGAEVSLVRSGDRDGRLELSGMPAPRRGRVYQVWLLRPGGKPEPTSALFVPRADGAGSVAVPGSLAGVAQVLVSAEPVGGSPAPTSTPLISVRTT